MRAGKKVVFTVGMGMLALALGSGVTVAQSDPGTTALVIVQQAPAGGSGPSFPQYQIVIPGPNPAQNTGVGLGEQLQMGTTPGTTVTVIPAPSP